MSVTPKSIDEIHEAFMRIHRLACGTSDRAYMSIPADPQRDADLIVSAAIDELRALRDSRAELEAALRECLPHLVALQLTGSSRLAGPLGQRVAALLAKVSP